MTDICRPQHHSQDLATFPHYWTNLLVYQGKYYPVRWGSMRYLNEVLYNLETVNMMYKTHPLYISCVNEVYKLYLDSPGSDLTNFLDPVTMYHFWGKFKRGEITEAELVTASCESWEFSEAERKQIKIEYHKETITGEVLQTVSKLFPEEKTQTSRYTLDRYHPLSYRF